MTSTITTARDLYESGDPAFCAMLETWETKKQCPLPLVDLLLEKGMVPASCLTIGSANWNRSLGT